MLIVEFSFVNIAFNFCFTGHFEDNKSLRQLVEFDYPSQMKRGGSLEILYRGLCKNAWRPSVAVAERSLALTESKYLRLCVKSPPAHANNFSNPYCKKSQLGTLSQGNSNLQWP